MAVVSPLAKAASLAISLGSSVALACPACAASAAETSVSDVPWLALLTLSPIVAGGALLLALRHAEKASVEERR